MHTTVLCMHTSVLTASSSARRPLPFSRRGRRRGLGHSCQRSMGTLQQRRNQQACYSATVVTSTEGLCSMYHASCIRCIRCIRQVSCVSDMHRVYQAGIVCIRQVSCVSDRYRVYQAGIVCIRQVSCVSCMTRVCPMHVLCGSSCA
jgi:hypothetical protein